jgi:hypothetical protein
MNAYNKVKVFLKNILGKNYIEFYELEQNIFSELKNKIQNKTRNQQKTLNSIILPRIAIYKTFLLKNYTQETSLGYVKEYINIKCKKMNKLYKSLEYIPYFNKLFFTIMEYEITHKDNWKVNIKTHNNKMLEFDIINCLWYNACIENNCKELCKYFCDADNIIYEKLKKITFERSGTIYYGNKCCDFKFKIK